MLPHASTSGDISLVLCDVTTLYFEAEKEDDLRKVGYSKERRVDPQIVVGLLVDRNGFPLELGARGYRISTRPLPYWLMWTIARFDKTLRLALDYVGVPSLVSADKAKLELGWTTRAAKESIVTTAESLLEHGVVPRRGTDKLAHTPQTGQ